MRNSLRKILKLYFDKQQISNFGIGQNLGQHHIGDLSKFFHPCLCLRVFVFSNLIGRTTNCIITYHFGLPLKIRKQKMFPFNKKEKKPCSEMKLLQKTSFDKAHSTGHRYTLHCLNCTSHTLYMR